MEWTVSVLQKLQAPVEQCLVAGLRAGVAGILQVSGHLLNAVFREEEADGIGRGVLRLVVVEAARGRGIAMCQNCFQAVQDRRVIILGAVRRVIAVAVGAVHAHLQTVGGLSGLHDRVRRRTEIAPNAIVVFLKIHDFLISGGNMNVIGKSGRHHNGAENKDGAEQHTQPPAPQGFCSCHETSNNILLSSIRVA